MILQALETLPSSSANCSSEIFLLVLCAQPGSDRMPDSVAADRRRIAGSLPSAAPFTGPHVLRFAAGSQRRHWHLNTVWRHCRSMEIPTSLAHGIVPEQHHPVVYVLSDEELSRFLNNIKSTVEANVAELPKYEAYLKQHCPAEQ
jgi:hypothetical protein